MTDLYLVTGFAGAENVDSILLSPLGICLVSCVGNLVSIEPYDSEVSEDQTGTLIVLSGAGMGVKKAVREAHNTYFDKS